MSGYGGMTSSLAIAPPPAFGATTTSSFGLGNKPTTLFPQQQSFGTLGGATTQSSAFGTGLTSLGQPQQQPSFGLALGATQQQPMSAFGVGQQQFGLGLTQAVSSAQQQPFGYATSLQQQQMQQPTLSTATSTTTAGLGGTLSSCYSSGILGSSQFGGGIGSLNTYSATGTDAASKSAKALKETAIPNELLETVEEFKKFVKEERAISSDIAHTSAKVHTKITDEIDGLGRLVTGLSSGMAKNRSLLDKLKLNAAEEIQNAEIAQRTRDTPPGLQYENVAPYEYFARLVSNFESQMMHYRRQIEETEQHLTSMASGGNTLTPEDIANALNKSHKAFVSLAAKYQAIHEASKHQTEAYIQLHRQRYGTSIDLDFLDTEAKKATSQKGQSKVPSTLGPTPFTGQPDHLAQAKAALLAQPQQQQQQQQLLQQPQQQMFQNQLGGPPRYGLGTTSTSSFGFGQPQQQPSLFGGGLQQQQQPQMGLYGGQPAQTQFSGVFNPTTTSALGTSSTPGLLGSTLSPFGATTNQSSLFQTGGKRGKH